MIYDIYIYWLVVQCAHLEKYESQWEGLSHISWEKNVETTNQYIYIMLLSLSDKRTPLCLEGWPLASEARNRSRVPDPGCFSGLVHVLLVLVSSLW